MEQVPSESVREVEQPTSPDVDVTATPASFSPVRREVTFRKIDPLLDVVGRSVMVMLVAVFSTRTTDA